MQSLKSGYDNYQREAIMTASPEKLTLMLYDGAIKFCNLAIQSLEKGDYESANNNVIKAQNIIVEFMSTLDFKYPVAADFAIMYDYIYRRLVESNIEKDASILREALELIRELRNTWEEAMNISKSPKISQRVEQMKTNA